MFVSDTFPLYASASSKTLLAFMPNVEDYVEHLTFEPITDRTICSKERRTTANSRATFCQK
ncbi:MULTISPECIES: IclR family transcriptional regulator C-terminal domain-containing protein [unclassified Lysinibacillus]|uniref:IclR family transcriptional regulator domain-containing protein n=1 Tax=unclassified Lysinibacillus TaxID=2636778 RepID=UPI00380A872B